jgi:NAD-dependent deacetylase sirtuin 5
MCSGLLQQTNHPASRLCNIHGSLNIIRCTACTYTITIRKLADLPFLALASPGLADLPHCPKCTYLLRPDVVWFGERLAAGAPDAVDEWLAQDGVELVLVVGSSLRVFPAAEWVGAARANGAVLALVDMDEEHGVELGQGDLWLKRDVALVLPEVLGFVERGWTGT